MTFDPNAAEPSGPVPLAPATSGTTLDPSAATGPVQDQDLQRRLLLIKNAAPMYGSSPDGIKVAMLLAQSSTDDATLVKNVKLSAAQSIIGSIKDQITTQ